MKRLQLREVVVVEGKYDKIRLSSLLDALIIETGGFHIFADPQKLELLRQLADTRGLLVLTDSDAAGFQIRNYLKGAIDPAKVKHAYIPDVYGKERRKACPGKEGKLGVEGMRTAVLYESLRRAGVVPLQGGPAGGAAISKTDLYELGLSGTANCAQRRRAVERALQLPEHLSTSAFLQVLNATTDLNTLRRLCAAALPQQPPCV